MTYKTPSCRLAGLCLVMAMAGLSGCASVGPDYTSPQTAIPAQWTAAKGAEAATGADAVLIHWWQTLNDPLLNNLIERAVAGNRDLAQAEARIREARARRGISEADLYPSVQASGRASRSRSSEEAGSGRTSELYSAGFDASWELDIFGGKRRAIEAASANIEASEYDRHSVLVTLLGEVALNYIDIRTFQARLAVAETNLRIQNDTYDIARWRNMAGLATQRDVEQARLNLEQTRAQIPVLRTSISQAGNRIAVLLGLHPGAVTVELAVPRAIPAAPASVAIGVPADALRQRPEVRRAERQLAVQTAQIGVATAALYPSFTLMGSIGLDALTAGRLLTSSALASSVTAAFGWAAFDAGRIRQNIAVQTALQEQALGRYEAAVLTALEDVENALTAYAAEQQRREALIAAATAARNAADLASHQYAAGLVDFQVVLDTQRSLLSLEDQVTASGGTVVSNVVRLYKALGGGWTPLAQPGGPAPAITPENKSDGAG